MRNALAPRVAVGSTGVLVVAGTLILTAIEVRLHDLGRADLSELDASVAPFLIGIVATLLMGVVLTARTKHPVGPLLLGLGVSMLVAADLDAYAALALLAEPVAIPGGPWLLYFSEATFVPWLVLVTLILLLTPSGHLPGPRWRGVPGVVIAAAVGLVVTRSLLPGHFSAPYDTYQHPVHLGLPGLGLLRLACGIVLSLAPLAAAVSLVTRFRRATGEQRQQLRWVGFGASIALVALLVTAVGAALNAWSVVAISSGIALGVLPVSIGVAVSRFRLFELDRVVSRTVTWVLVSLVLIGTWAAAVILVSTTLSERMSSPLAASIATLTAAGAARPVLQWVGDRVDRRFQRRRYDALNQVTAYIRRPAGGSDPGGIAQVLATALDDPTLTVCYWLHDEKSWVDTQGSPVEVPPNSLLVARDSVPIAYVSSVAEGSLLDVVCHAALPELEATQLRAALQLRIAEIGASRARLSKVAEHERANLERDLHDGVQQRLLASLFALEAADRRSTEAAREPLHEAIQLTKLALNDLRNVAHGLRPANLDQGLYDALSGLVAGSPVPTRLYLDGVPPEPPETAATVTYYVVAEALTNIAKHSDATTATITVSRIGSQLRVTVVDDGTGTPDPGGSGLRGISDRAEAAGGSLVVTGQPGAGTKVEMVLPCE